LRVTYEELFYLWDNYYLRDIYLKKFSYQVGFEKFLSHLCLDETQIKNIVDKSNSIKEMIEKDTKPYDWVYDYLPKIKSKGVSVGILTDSENSAVLIKKRYEKWKIAMYIDSIISSADTGFIKPYRESYLAILKELELEIDDVVFIGHDKDEIIGAKIIGIRTINFFKKKEFISFLNRLIND